MEVDLMPPSRPAWLVEMSNPTPAVLAVNVITPAFKVTAAPEIVPRPVLIAAAISVTV
jgi:hypothetical protein